METAFGYLRTSSLSQQGNTSFSRQKSTIQSWSNKNKVYIQNFYEDVGVSGTIPLFGRENLKSCLYDAQKVGARYLLIEKQDRLARSNLVSEMILMEFRKIGVQIICCESGTNLSEDGDSSSILIRQVLQSVAEYEKNSLVSKMKSARDRIRASGSKCEGRKKYGSTEDERHLIRKVKALRRKNKFGKRRAYSDIANLLNESGFRNRKGDLFTSQRILQISNM